MHKIVCFVYLFFHTATGFAQPAIDWSKCYGGSFSDQGYALVSAPGNSFVCAGYAGSANGDVINNRGNNDYWLFKVSAAGQLLWQKTYGGTYNDECYDMQPTSDGGYILAGRSFFNSGQVTGNHGDSDFWIVKVDSLGNLLWQKSFGGNNADVAQGILPTADGGYLATGYTNSTNGDVVGFHGPNYSDVWVVKLDAAGNKQWARVFGGTADDLGTAAVQLPGGGYLVTARTESVDGDVTGNHGLMEGWLLRLDAGGNLLWQRAYGGTENDQFNHIVATGNGQYIISGAAASRNGDLPAGPYTDYLLWTLKIDAAGNIIWLRKYYGGNTGGNYAYSAKLTPDGGCLVAGSGFVTTKAQQGIITRFDAQGNQLWQKVMGGNSPDYLNDLIVNPDGSCTAIGLTLSNANGDVPANHGPGWVDIWMVRLSAPAVSWTGGVSPDWTNPANWSEYFVPQGANEVVVSSGTPFSPVIFTGTTGYCKSVRLTGTALLTVQTGAQLKQGSLLQ